MKQLPLIQGAGGGSTSGSESSDTVRGTQIFDVIDLISEGECEGLVNGLQSIYFDGVPLQAADGTMNFSGVTVQTTPGTQGQAAISGVDGVQNEIAVGVTVVYATPVVRTITNPAIDTCRVTIIVPQLSNTDASTGDLGGSSFGWSIEVQSNGGGYVEVFRETLSAKTMSRYPRAQSFKLAGPAPWDIKVRRLTPDSTSANTVNAFGWSTYTEIQSVKLRYPNSCLIRTRGGAEQFSRVPVRSFDWLGRRIQVPSNYDPKTRIYTGIWDGTFKTAWSDNPAWIYHDMVAHNRYGLGHYITTTDSFKWELYAIGRYCDVMVPDGNGGVEPRFRASPGFETREQAYKVLTELAAIFRGIVFWMNEDVSVAQDAPSDPVAHFTRANVVPSAPGRFFAYTGSSNAKRYSSVIVWFNDLSQQGKLVPEVVVRPDLEAELGVKPLELSPMGIWSRGQAHRIGAWALYTQEEESEGVGFKVGFDGVLVQPGKVFKVSDPNEAAERLAGRVSAATTTQVTLDADVMLRAGEVYSLTVMLRDAADLTKLVSQMRGVITGAGTTRMLTVAPAFAAAPARETVWLLESDRVNATTWRCIGVAETAGEKTYTITGIAHQPGKYALIDRGVTFTKPPVSRVLLTPPRPTEVGCTEAPYLVGAYAKSRVTISWAVPLIGLSYLVRWRINAGPWTELPWTSDNAVDVDGLAKGLFEAGVRSRNALGNVSNEQLVSLPLLGWTKKPGNVLNFKARVVQGGVLFTWDANQAANYLATTLKIGGVILFEGAASSYTWPWPDKAVYSVSATHWDTSLNESEAPASVWVVVDESVQIQWKYLFGTGKPSDNATSDLSLVATEGQISLTGNAAVKVGGLDGGGGAQVYSTTSYAGGCCVAWVVGAIQDVVFGLNQDPLTDADVASIDYAMDVYRGSGALYAYESGTAISLSATAAVGDNLAIVYNNVDVRYYQNGILLRTVSAPSNRRFFVDSCFYYLGASVRNIRFIPMSSANLGSQQQGHQGGAINSDPSFQDLSAASAYSGGVSIVAITDGAAGINALQMVGQSYYATNIVPIATGKKYRVSVWMRWTVSGSNILWLRLHIRNGVGAEISYSIGVESVATSNNWQRFSGIVLAPASSVSGYASIDSNYNGSGTQQFQDCRLEEVIDTDLLADQAATLVAITTVASDTQTVNGALQIDQCAVNYVNRSAAPVAVEVACAGGRELQTNAYLGNASTTLCYTLTPSGGTAVTVTSSVSCSGSAVYTAGVPQKWIDSGALLVNVPAGAAFSAFLRLVAVFMDSRLLPNQPGTIKSSYLAVRLAAIKK